MYRSEHWTVVEGTANITLNNKIIVLKIEYFLKKYDMIISQRIN